MLFLGAKGIQRVDGVNFSVDHCFLLFDGFGGHEVFTLDSFSFLFFEL